MKYKFKCGSQKMNITDTEIFINSPRFWISKDMLVDIDIDDSLYDDCCNVQILSKDGTGTMKIHRSDVSSLHDIINYFKPIMEGNKKDYLEAQKDSLRREMIDEGKHTNNDQYRIHYLGGHPLYPNESDAVIEIKEDRVLLYFYHEEYELGYQDIENVSIKTQEEVLRRMTATRYALFGIYALAMQKKEINKTNYIIIECENFILSFSEHQKVLKVLYKAFEAYKEQHFVTSQVTIDENLKNFELIKKLKELLDIDAITKEEFEAKKKQLLGL